MGKTLADLYTPGGHRLDEAASALQKTIRRGLEVEAVYWAQEIQSKYYKFLWKRLITISHEDIGPADSSVAVLVDVCHRQYMEAYAGRRLDHLSLVHAVVAMCRAPKSRVVDHLVSKIHLTDVAYDVPDYALDKHTRRGRQLKRGLDHFYEEGAVISPDIGDTEYLEEAWAIDKDKNPRPWMEKAFSRKGERVSPLPPQPPPQVSFEFMDE